MVSSLTNTIAWLVLAFDTFRKRYTSVWNYFLLFCLWSVTIIFWFDS